jgi:hypothetical protein
MIGLYTTPGLTQLTRMFFNLSPCCAAMALLAYVIWIIAPLVPAVEQTKVPAEHCKCIVQVQYMSSQQVQLLRVS